MDQTKVWIVPDSSESNKPPSDNVPLCNNDQGVYTEEEPVLCNIFSQSHYNNNVNDSASICDIFSSVCETEHFENSVFLEKQNKLNKIAELNELDDFYGLNVDAVNEGFGHCAHDTWVPSMLTSVILKSIKNNTYDNNLVNKSLTTPVLSFKHNMVDSMTKLMRKTLGQTEAMQRNIMSADDVTQDVFGLKELISLEFYRSAIDLTGRLLSNVTQEEGKECSIQSGHTVNTIQLWFTRFCLLAKLQEWFMLDIEVSVWENCDRPDLYYQFYPDVYGDREGSMVPFQMRLLLATIPSYCNRNIESFNRLLEVLGVVKNIRLHFEVEQTQLSSNKCSACFKVWKARESRTIILLVNVALKMEDFSLAVEIVTNLINNDSGSITKRMLYSTLGRIYLQSGDITASKKCFDKARGCVEIVGFLGHSAHDLQDFVDRGLLAFAQNNFEEAYKLFEMASYIDSSNVMVMNNCAMCLMYMGHIKEAIRLLSGVIHNNPAKALHDNIVMNLTSFYELESSNLTDKKLQLLKMICLHKSDLIQASSLKMSL